MTLYAGVFLGMSIGFGSIFEWTLHGQRVYQPLPPERHWAARVRFVGGGLVYVIAILVALFNAIAAFVLIALVAVYYIVERTPVSRPARTPATATAIQAAGPLRPSKVSKPDK